MQKLTSAILILSLAGCAATQPKTDTYDLINSELGKAAKTNNAKQPDAVAAALLPPMQIEIPRARQPLEERFGISFNNVPAQQFFMGIVSGTRYSMLVHPDVSGSISVNLKDVTLFEALEAVREIYGYDYRLEGTRIYVKPITMQTRVFHVNYLTGSRQGTSDIRVTSGSVSDVAGNNSANTIGANPNQIAGNTGGSGATAQSLNSSKITTTSRSDFWSELRESLVAIVGNKDGRNVVVSPQSGIVVVRAMWDELRNVSDYLKATQLSVDRQVILDAKILEVELNDSYQAGVNWASFASFASFGSNLSNRVSTGFVQPGSTLRPLPFEGGEPPAISSGTVNTLTATTGYALSAAAGAAGSMFGFAVQTSNFAALISFLETQGTVHVLSSPRIATLNNQKAVLKVGKDEFFVTNVSSTTTATGNTSSTTPNVVLQPFFSGVALDVTPQIGETGNIILHIHPSVSNVTTVDKPLNLGNAGSISLPLASSTISETDSVVRGQDGQIVAIGGLMRQASIGDRSQVPGAGDVPVLGGLFRNTRQTIQKRELVILLRPTVVQGSNSWTQDMTDAQRRIEGLAPRRTLD